MCRLYLFLLFGFSMISFASGQKSQGTFQLSGKVIDASTGETLIGATVRVEQLSTGTTTNGCGFYSIQLPISEDSLTIAISYVGYLERSKMRLLLNCLTMRPRW